MEWSKIVIDNIAHLVVLVIFGGFAYLMRHSFLDPLKVTQLALKQHIEECNKTPKILILEKIDSLKEDIKEIKKKIL